LNKVSGGVWHFKGRIWDSVSKEAKNLITKLLTRNVEKRLSAVAALAHPWIKYTVKTKFNVELGKAAMKNLGTFQGESKMIQATLTFLTSHLMTKQ